MVTLTNGARGQRFNRAVVKLLLGYRNPMTMEALKSAMAKLPLEERHSLASWLQELECDAGDKQTVQGLSPGGRGITWVDKVKREIAEGRTIALQQGRDLAQASRRPSHQ